MSNTLLSDEITGMVTNSSWIRKMFEEGIELKKKYGKDNVYDFSLGNPDLPAPAGVKAALTEIAEHAGDDFAFGYMPNAGLPETRKVLADQVTKLYGVPMTGDHVVVTVGAAGGLNVFFRAVLNPGDEVICPAPYFVEYKFYTGNYGGKLVPVPSHKEDFSLDLDAIDKTINAKTRAFIINSPNNPTGAIYSEKEIQGLSAILERRSKEFGRTIYLISDEPYRILNYDNMEIPTVLKYYSASLIIGSFSKSLSLAGERIGYIAVNTELENSSMLISALAMTNRILGFVNAPVIAQKILLKVDSGIDVERYRKRRNMMAELLDYAGVDYVMPHGAFYFFPKSPVEDEFKFINALVNERILAVPGSGFGMGGFVRLAFCVPEKTITGAAEGFKRAVASLR